MYLDWQLLWHDTFDWGLRISSLNMVAATDALHRSSSLLHPVQHAELPSSGS